MSETILIYGRSDDLIIFAGAMGEELYADYGEPTTIEFDNGDTFEVEYTSEGVWTVEPVQIGNDMTKVEVLDEGTIESLSDYSEVAVYQPWDGANEVSKQ